jgi:hypothetical protein
MSDVTLADAFAVLGRTPATLRAWLDGLPETWVRDNEGPDTWSPYDIVGHLIHGEQTDWMPRVRQIAEGRGHEPFVPFDRTAMLRLDQTRPLAALLDEFAALRARNLLDLEALGLSDDGLDAPGLHPDLGPVTLGQLLATWVAHDLTHLGQMARVMAKRYRDAVGPWRDFLPLLDR